MGYQAREHNYTYKSHLWNLNTRSGRRYLSNESLIVQNSQITLTHKDTIYTRRYDINVIWPVIWMACLNLP